MGLRHGECKNCRGEAHSITAHTRPDGTLGACRSSEYPGSPDRCRCKRFVCGCELCEIGAPQVEWHDKYGLVPKGWRPPENQPEPEPPPPPADVPAPAGQTGDPVWDSASKERPNQDTKNDPKQFF